MSASAPKTHSVEHNGHMRLALTGKPKTEAHKEAIKSVWKRRRLTPVSEETRQKMAASHLGKKMPESHKKASTRNNLKRWASYSEEEKRVITMPGLLAAKKANPSSIETTVALLLDSLGVAYIPQYRIKRYIVDFFIPSKNLVIECDGDYWHSLPGRVESDRKKDEYLASIGVQILRLPETQIVAGAAEKALLQVL